MSGLFVECGKGCGGMLELDEQTVKNMIVLGQPVTAEHQDCHPPEPEPLRRFRLMLWLTEVGDLDEEKITEAERAALDLLPGELFAYRGATVEADNFPNAVNGPLTRWLEAAWTQMQEKDAAYADLPVR